MRRRQTTQQPSINGTENAAGTAPAAAPKTAKPKAAALPKADAAETKQQNGEAGSSALEQETFGARKQDEAPAATQAPEKENGQAEQVPENAPAPTPRKR